MKKIIAFIVLVIASSNAFSDDTPPLGALYKFISPMLLSKCNENGDTIDQPLPISVGWQFTILKIVPKGVIISFPQWPVSGTFDKTKPDNNKAIDNSNDKLNSDYHGTDSSPIYFLIQSKEINDDAVRLQHGGTVSLVTGASFIKFRPGSGTPINKGGTDYYKNTDISNDFTLSLLGSIKLTSAGSNSDFFGLFGFNFSSIKVTPASTQGFLSSETNVGSISPTIGFEYQIDRVQFGLLSGVDILTGDVNRYWVYRGRPWLALGIGFSLLKGYGTSSGNSNK